MLVAKTISIFHLSTQVNAQLYSGREKAELANVVNIMISYNMTYHQEKSPEGQYEYNLDPWVFC